MHYNLKKENTITKAYIKFRINVSQIKLPFTTSINKVLLVAKALMTKIGYMYL